MTGIWINCQTQQILVLINKEMLFEPCFPEFQYFLSSFENYGKFPDCFFKFCKGTKNAKLDFTKFRQNRFLRCSTEHVWKILEQLLSHDSQSLTLRNLFCYSMKWEFVPDLKQWKMALCKIIHISKIFRLCDVPVLFAAQGPSGPPVN